MKRAACLAPIAEEPALPVASDNRDIRRPDFQANEHAIESAAGIDKGVAVMFDDENDIERVIKYLVEDKVAATIDGNLQTCTEGSATNEAERDETPSFQQRPPIREVLPGAYRVPAPDADRVVDDFTISPPSVAESPTVATNPTVAVSAQLFDATEENQIINERVERALREARERESLAQVVADSAQIIPDSVDNRPPPNTPKRWLVPSLNRGEIILAVITAALFVAAIILWVVFATMEEDPIASAFPTQSPTV
mmetsp:Transcript_13389/g.24216  ORF Transcript_13389/g.24216 Transcript_13389/m.24216 type:complete len:254 (+) Transcript_13389:1021-1782(+)